MCIDIEHITYKRLYRELKCKTYTYIAHVYSLHIADIYICIYMRNLYRYKERERASYVKHIYRTCVYKTFL